MAVGVKEFRKVTSLSARKLSKKKHHIKRRLEKRLRKIACMRSKYILDNKNDAGSLMSAYNGCEDYCHKKLKVIKPIRIRGISPLQEDDASKEIKNKSVTDEKPKEATFEISTAKVENTESALIREYADFTNQKCNTENKLCMNEESLNFSLKSLIIMFFIFCASIATFFSFFMHKTRTRIKNQGNKDALRQLKQLKRKLKSSLRIGRKLINKRNKSNRKRNCKMYTVTDRNKLEESTNGTITSRQIVDFGYIWQQLQNNVRNHYINSNRKCTFRNWEFNIDNNFHRGLRTKFSFQCKRYKEQFQIWSERRHENVMNINQCSALGIIAEGLGYSQVNGLFATMSIKYVSDKTFKANQEILLQHLTKISAASMKQAAEEEARLAVKADEITENGIPFITVIVDGSWIKRSFVTKYDSLSGLGAIVGKRTGKVLYVGIKNKFCTKCHRASTTGISAKEHVCYKNYPRSAPSTLMESQALIEGFQESIEVNGLVYKFFIGDGDSNFYKNLVDANPYSDMNIIPKKIECTNHLLRNLCRKLNIVASITQRKGKRVLGFVGMREIVKKNILSIRQEIVDQVDKVSTDENKSWELKVQNLRRRILNIPSHIFGEHKKCRSDGLVCYKNKSEKEKNYVPYLKVHGLYQPIEDAIRYLSCYAESLLHKVTNNFVESFNNIVCKEVNGKRINYAASNQYNTRVAIAILQHNSQEAISDTYKGMNKDVPDTVTKLEMKRKLKIEQTREYRALYRTKRKYVCNKTDKNYGPNCEKPDLPLAEYNALCDEHFKKLKENQSNRVEIEFKTRQQSNSDLWIALRKKMLTASNFGRIYRMRPSTSCANTVKSILYPALESTVAMMYGCDTEDVARKELSEIIRKDIKINGIFIDEEDPRFATSPDGIIDDDGIVEIKNPLSAINLTAEEAIKTIPHLKIIDKKTNSLKKTHQWYYQIQGQLHVTKRKYCVFALRTPKSMVIRVIRRDDHFWEIEMKRQLSNFYDNCLMPEIIDSRFLRNMPIRDPSYIKKAKEEYLAQNQLRRTIKKQPVDTANIELLLKQNSMEYGLTENTDDEVVFVSSTNNSKAWTSDDVANIRKYLDTRHISLNEIRFIILDTEAWLNDDALDAFLNVIRKKSDIEVQSVLYISYLIAVEPAQTEKSAAILGGQCTNHWQLAYYNGSSVRIYDSLNNNSNRKPAHKEMQYILKRFPNITEKDVIFMDIKCVQADGNSCGIYAAALLTYIALKDDPSEVCFSNNIQNMRNHFLKIIRSGKLSQFPIESQ